MHYAYSLYGIFWNPFKNKVDFPVGISKLVLIISGLDVIAQDKEKHASYIRDMKPCFAQCYLMNL